jgi:predicted membrane channel-forming protein YqfA (hemolysin III family)
MLTILAAIAGIALFSSVFTYVEPIRPRFLSYKTKWVSVPLFLLFALLVLALVISVSFSLNHAVNELVKLQAAK